MSIFDTVENDRTKFTQRTLDSLLKTVDLTKHRLFLVDNASCQATKDFLDSFKKMNYTYHKNITIITNEVNLGTAEAVNLAWKHRLPGEHAIKMDNDVVIHQSGWVEYLEEAANRDPKLGQIGLKRKDCDETPWHRDIFYRSIPMMLPHQKGQRWLLVERTNHVIGTCVLHSDNLLEKTGYMYQPGLYGFDDALFSYRSLKAGFFNYFLSHVEVDHIDDGSNPYQKVKEAQASEKWAAYQQTLREYEAGTRSIHYNPFKK